MNATHKRAAAILLVMIWLTMAAQCPLTAQTPKGGDIAVVVNSDTPVSDLSLSEVRKVLLGERQYWNSKLPVTLLIRAPVARERDVVLRVIYQMSEAQFKQYWVAKIFRAEARSPPMIMLWGTIQSSLATAIPGPIALGG